MTPEQKRERQRILNHRLFSVPPIDRECDCGATATLWSAGKDAVCARCQLLYTFAYRIEVQGRILGFSRKGSGAYMPVERTPEIQMELFLSFVDYKPDEITIVGHGTYHLPILKEAA